jgi:hypothetical protein
MTVENKQNLCGQDGDCKSPNEPLKQLDCEHYGSTPYHLCAHLGWTDCCMNEKAKEEAKK